MKEKVEVEKVFSRKPNVVVPTLVKFQNGKLSAFTKENTNFSSLRNRETKNQLSALLVANGNTYLGAINDTEASELTDTYICVRNKTTNKMTIIPIDQVTLKNTVYNKIDKVQRIGLSERVSRMTLLKKFGSRKASRFVNDQEKMRMDIKIVQDELKTTVDEANILDDFDKSIDNSAHFNKIRPKINFKANQLSEIYEIGDVIPNELLQRLDEEAKTVYQTPIDQIPIQSEYLKKLVENIQLSSLDNTNLLRIKIIIYMDSLLRLIKCRNKQLKKAELSEISQKIENNVRERFADPNAKFSGCRTSFSTEKALCHFIVLALLIENNYQTDYAILSQELNTQRSKVLQYAHIVQALPKARTTILCLKLPEVVPPLPAKFSRRK